MAKTILDKIVANKKEEVKRAKGRTPLTALKGRIGERERRDFAGAVRGKGLKLIAEVKKASPSRGVLCPDFKPVALAQTYARHGAAAVSVLTESKYFQGSLEHLKAIRQKVNIPLLRKDFIFDEYQLYESVVNGADAILLITALLEKETMESFLELGESLKLDCLVEVHNEEELTRALLAGAKIIGINNRDLNTFKTNINTTRRLRMLIPEDTIVVSESGINTSDDIKKLKECRVDAVLVGEALVTAKDIPSKMKELLA